MPRPNRNLLPGAQVAVPARYLYPKHIVQSRVADTKAETIAGLVVVSFGKRENKNCAILAWNAHPDHEFYAAKGNCRVVAQAALPPRRNPQAAPPPPAPVSPVANTESSNLVHGHNRHHEHAQGQQPSQPHLSSPSQAMPRQHAGVGHNTLPPPPQPPSSGPVRFPTAHMHMQECSTPTAMPTPMPTPHQPPDQQNALHVHEAMHIPVSVSDQMAIPMQGQHRHEHEQEHQHLEHQHHEHQHHHQYPHQHPYNYQHQHQHQHQPPQAPHSLQHQPGQEQDEHHQHQLHLQHQHQHQHQRQYQHQHHHQHQLQLQHPHQHQNQHEHQMFTQHNHPAHPISQAQLHDDAHDGNRTMAYHNSPQQAFRHSKPQISPERQEKASSPSSGTVDAQLGRSDRVNITGTASLHHRDPERDVAPAHSLMQHRIDAEPRVNFSLPPPPIASPHAAPLNMAHAQPLQQHGQSGLQPQVTDDVRGRAEGAVPGIASKGKGSAETRRTSQRNSPPLSEPQQVLAQHRVTHESHSHATRQDDGQRDAQIPPCFSPDTLGDVVTTRHDHRRGAVQLEVAQNQSYGTAHRVKGASQNQQDADRSDPQRQRQHQHQRQEDSDAENRTITATHHQQQHTPSLSRSSMVGQRGRGSKVQLVCREESPEWELISLENISPSTSSRQSPSSQPAPSHRNAKARAAGKADGTDADERMVVELGSRGVEEGFGKRHASSDNPRKKAKLMPSDRRPGRRGAFQVVWRDAFAPVTEDTRLGGPHERTFPARVHRAPAEHRFASAGRAAVAFAHTLPFGFFCKRLLPAMNAVGKQEHGASFQPIADDEFLRFLAIRLLIAQYPCHAGTEFWNADSSSNEAGHDAMPRALPSLSRAMTRARFTLISDCLTASYKHMDTKKVSEELMPEQPDDSVADPVSACSAAIMALTRAWNERTRGIVTPSWLLRAETASLHGDLTERTHCCAIVCSETNIACAVHALRSMRGTAHFAEDDGMSLCMGAVHAARIQLTKGSVLALPQHLASLELMLHLHEDYSLHSICAVPQLSSGSTPAFARVHSSPKVPSAVLAGTWLAEAPVIDIQRRLSHEGVSVGTTLVKSGRLCRKVQDEADEQDVSQAHEAPVYVVGVRGLASTHLCAATCSTTTAARARTQLQCLDGRTRDIALPVVMATYESAWASTSTRRHCDYAAAVTTHSLSLNTPLSLLASTRKPPSLSPIEIAATGTAGSTQRRDSVQQGGMASLISRVQRQRDEACAGERWWVYFWFLVGMGARNAFFLSRHDSEQASEGASEKATTMHEDNDAIADTTDLHEDYGGAPRVAADGKAFSAYLHRLALEVLFKRSETSSRHGSAARTGDRLHAGKEERKRSAMYPPRPSSAPKDHPRFADAATAPQGALVTADLPTFGAQHQRQEHGVADSVHDPSQQSHAQGENRVFFASEHSYQTQTQDQHQVQHQHPFHAQLQPQPQPQPQPHQAPAPPLHPASRTLETAHVLAMIPKHSTYDRKKAIWVATLKDKYPQRLCVICGKRTRYYCTRCAPDGLCKTGGCVALHAARFA